MRTVDKQGVHLEQCDKCRGIFLDHGELEHILQAEQQYYGSPVAPYAPPGRQTHPEDFRQPHQRYQDSPRPYGRYPDSPRPYGGRYPDSPRPYQHRRRGGFLRELFD